MEWMVAFELVGGAALLRVYGRRPEQQLRTALGRHLNGDSDEHRAERSFMRVGEMVRSGLGQPELLSFLRKKWLCSKVRNVMGPGQYHLR